MDFMSRGAYDSAIYDNATPGDAAISVGVMIVTATLLLVVMKQSGFRAMVAVGRG